MKKIIIVVLVLFVAIFAGVYAGRKLKTNKTKTAKNDFVYGVQCGAFTLNKQFESYNSENTAQKIAKLKELGVNTVRANFEMSINDPFSITPYEDLNDRYITALTDNKFDVLLVIDPNIPATIGTASYEKEGYAIGSYVAKRYKGKIKYYQLANEVSGSVVKPSDPKFTGETFKDSFGLEYSTQRYEAVKGWVTGMSKAIREQDPNAQIVLSGHWVLYEVVDRLIKDGVDFDILGWAWYANDGNDVTKRETPDGKGSINLGQELSKFGKKLWIIESNLADGTYPKEDQTQSQLEEDQAAFIQTFLPHVADSGYFSGYFFFTLFDDPVAGEVATDREAHWGLVEVKKVGDENKVIRNKPGFEAYKRAIEELSGAVTSS